MYHKYITTPLLRFVKRSNLNRYLVGFVFVFFSGLTTVWVINVPVRYVFLSMTDGNSLLSVQSLTAERVIDQSEDLNLVFCRNPLVRVIAFDNVRTFYIGAKGTLVGQRTLPDGVLYEKLKDNKCLPLTIQPSQRPNKPGTYYFCQELSFRTEFNQLKTASFCSTVYKVKEDTKI